MNKGCGDSICLVKMSSNSLGKGRKHGIATIFRMLIACVLLSGGFIFQSPSQCFVSAEKDDQKDEKDKDKDKNKDKDKDKNNDKDKDKNKDLTEWPSEQPSLRPTHSPTGSPTRPVTPRPTNIPTVPPTGIPTSSPTKFAFEAALPEINIDITTVVDDIFSFAALLLDKDVIETGDNNDVNNRNGLNAYFERFVIDLLIASEAVTPSSLDSVNLEVKFLPLEDEEIAPSSSQTATTNTAATTGTPVRISIKGKMKYLLGEGETSDEIDISLLEDRMCFSLAVYFTFWSTDGMRASLSEYGVKNPQITAVRVDDKLILVAADPNQVDGDTGRDDTSGIDGGSDDGNLLVVPTDSGDVIEMNDSFPSIAAGVGAPRRMGLLVSLAATVGSSFLLFVATILA